MIQLCGHSPRTWYQTFSSVAQEDAGWSSGEFFQVLVCYSCLCSRLLSLPVSVGNFTAVGVMLQPGDHADFRPDMCILLN